MILGWNILNVRITHAHSGYSECYECGSHSPPSLHRGVKWTEGTNIPNIPTNSALKHFKLASDPNHKGGAQRGSWGLDSRP